MANKQQERSTFLLSLASYVGGLREGWRRIRGDVAKRAGETKVTAAEVLEVQEKRGQEQTERECLADHGTRENSQTQFERFLLSLPRVDSVDRTVDWVLAQPDHIEEREGDRFANLHTRGLQRLTRQKASNLTQEPNRTGTDEIDFSRVSWSRYESERGTIGRGTPPTQLTNQPRLDSLLQQIYRHQERNVFERKGCGKVEGGNGDVCAGGEGVRVCGRRDGVMGSFRRPQQLTGTINFNNIRRPSNPKMTMVTGLQIRPAPIASRKNGNQIDYQYLVNNAVFKGFLIS